MIEIGPDLGTEPTARDRVVRVGAEVGGATVFDCRDDAAGVRAIVRASAANLQGGHGGVS